ncbi:S-adenosyl-methyltransferase MraW [Paludibacter propionicigenes WB4]|uniref:Ribosomal RNA small subunit methyltransferase H n=1 Tax=Paludibacter propionicigenes (strain DSM 17365 / JCM 13257 / WB4) TaxID=694427 RepID=E4T4K8_PALPW|nr:16S rRNA (cytosine(1402)-N(4))-methyltransferase RsmH [Paludibacter propionicigenes]ADQ79652.1 S-adenosyl-methyltransferase MraW [Paludibacter propionicigenes WB4]
MKIKKKNIDAVSTSGAEEIAYHIPALLDETITGLNIKPNGVYVDVTFGGGGHSREILKHLGADGKLLGFDQDEDAIKNTIDDPRFIFVRSNFRYMKNFLKYHGIDKVDGILADLGVSSHHFDEAERGFSFRFDGALDMRMNTKSSFTAAALLNTYTEEQLADVFYLYGELHNSRKIARTIVAARNSAPFDRIFPFIEVLKPFFGREKEKKDMARVFQALRIEVNKEMDVLKALLDQSIEVLNPQGRLAVLTYHSLEDRLVKNFIRSGNFEGKLEKDFYGNILAPLKAVNTKVIVADEAEVARNPRARSAKLRVAELINS